MTRIPSSTWLCFMSLKWWFRTQMSIVWAAMIVSALCWPNLLMSSSIDSCPYFWRPSVACSSQPHRDDNSHYSSRCQALPQKWATTDGRVWNHGIVPKRLSCVEGRWLGRSQVHLCCGDSRQSVRGSQISEVRVIAPSFVWLWASWYGKHLLAYCLSSPRCWLSLSPWCLASNADS